MTPHPPRSDAGDPPGATARPTLTDRYVWAATHRLAEPQRADVESELRATIADMVDARLASAPPDDDAARAAAEVAALTELGDPDRLAAQYRGRPDYLIGPDIFPDYRRLLRLLLSIVPAAAGGGVALASVLAGDGFLDVVTSGVGVALTAALHVAFWTTLGFAVAERSDTARREARSTPWDPSRLPEVPSAGRVTPGDVVASILSAVLAIGLLLWQRDATWFTTPDGAPIPFFNPDRWDFWLPFVIAVLAAGVVLDLLRLGRGRWTWPLAAANAGLDLLLAIPFLGLLGADPLINPAFLAEIAAVTGSTTPGDLFARSIGAVVVAVCIWDAIEGLVKARRAARRP